MLFYLRGQHHNAADHFLATSRLHVPPPNGIKPHRRGADSNCGNFLEKAISFEGQPALNV